MALINVVKCETNNRVLVSKYPSENLRLGSQLVVYTGQKAFFVKGGQILDEFDAGTYTLITENLPLLDKLINLPFGKKSPSQAEVWFVNTLAILDSKWGTPTPIQLEDPKYEIVLPVRAFGQYGIRVNNPRLFMETLVGNMRSFSTEHIDAYFKGKMMSLMANLISDKINKDNISFLNVNSYLIDISKYMQERLNTDFEKYGLSLEDFSVMSINVPENDPSYIKLKETKDLRARVNIAGRDIYQMDRSFDVMDKAAANEGNGGNMMNMGVGLAAGMAVGQHVGNMATSVLNLGEQVPPPIPHQVQYYVAVDNQQKGPYDMQHIVELIRSNQINTDTLVWKQGMANWDKISSLQEFSHFFMTTPPPLNFDKQ